MYHHDLVAPAFCMQVSMQYDHVNRLHRGAVSQKYVLLNLDLMLNIGGGVF